ncbi:MAG: tetratricopeptide repeat protein [Myxococcales bacterium FL481]|nr:MAG: tetratricopeptide repeat protein [Myxococcales bacterium FL481]
MADETETTQIRAPANRRPQRRLGGLSLALLSGQDAGRVIAVRSREVLIGRGEHADLRLAADDISRKHAKIILDVDGIAKIVDLRSVNGTYVNGRQVEVEVLREGDRIRIGMKATLDVRYDYGADEETEEPSPEEPAVESITEQPRASRRPRAMQTIPATSLEPSELDPQRNFREAVAAYQRVLEMREQRLGPHHPSVAAVLIDIGNTLATQAEHAEAEQFFRRALTIYSSRRGGSDDDRIDTMIAIGECCLARGGHVDAAALLEPALRHRESDGSAPHALARVRFALARALGESGADPDRAQKLAKQARSECDDTDEQRHLMRSIDRWLATSARAS